MSNYTGYNMPPGCSNVDIPGFDCPEDDYCIECGEYLDECKCDDPDYTVDDYEEEEDSHA